jgi:hypothetical protein
VAVRKGRKLVGLNVMQVLTLLRLKGLLNAVHPDVLHGFEAIPNQTNAEYVSMVKIQTG